MSGEMMTREALDSMEDMARMRMPAVMMLGDSQGSKEEQKTNTATRVQASYFPFPKVEVG